MATEMEALTCQQDKYMNNRFKLIAPLLST